MSAVKFISIIFIVLGISIWTVSGNPFWFQRVSDPVIKLGIDVLEEQGFGILKNRNIGVLTNQAGVNSKGELTWKILKNTPGVHLKAIFAPVHGLEGKFMSLETFYNDEIDDIPVYSVFASNSRPKDEWLRGLDAVVIDLQGLGIRYYNYWAFMLYMMIACFENDIEVVVLDRPNPLGGNYVGGPTMDSIHTSAWGPVSGMPLFHGMTIGELANYCKNLPEGITAHKQVETGVIHSGLIATPELLAKGKLTVIPMEGWKRKMLWQHTGLKWSETSPHIANLRSAYEYAFMTLALFVSSNYGFDNCNFIKMEPDWECNLPFHRFSLRHAIPKAVVKEVANVFRRRNAGFSLAVSPEYKNCVEVEVKDIRKVKPCLFGLVMLSLARQSTRFYINSEENLRFLGTHIGDAELLKKLSEMQNIDVEYFEDKWEKEALQFVEKTKAYQLYE
jgi:uncharacterized protein YbbC (DUF1343 family)